MINKEKIEREVKDFKVDELLFEDSLGKFIRSLMYDYKMMLIREAWFFGAQYKPMVNFETKDKYKKSLAMIEKALSLLLSLFDRDPKIKKEILDETQDIELLRHMVLKEQLLNIENKDLDDLIEYIDEFFKNREGREL